MGTTTLRAHSANRELKSDREGSTVWFWTLVAVVVLLVGLLVAWLAGWLGATTDPRVKEILALQEEARTAYAANGGPRTLVEATAAVAAMSTIRQKVDALPERLRPQVERASGSMMRDVFRGRIDAYFAASPEQRRAELDRQIDQEEVMRKAFEAASAVASVVGGGRREGGGGATGGASGGGNAPRGGAQEDRNRWRKNIIDRTSPEDRARYTEYRRAMEERRQERGLPSGGPR